MIPVQPVASYRVQLTPSFGFADLAQRLGRLHALGISHVYLSPVAEAVPGSPHGYDVVDHTRVREELGGLEGLTTLLDALAGLGMAAIIDHVPNHVAVGRAELNRPWWQMLRDGPDSAGARWFDVDWRPGYGKVLLPVLGQPLGQLLAIGAVTVAADVAELRIGDVRLPMAAGTDALPASDAVEQQHYRLLDWRRPERNVRRFFTIDSLVAVRVEHPEVAAAVDTIPRLLVDHAGFGGLRVDHVDGLADPEAYLTGLRELIGDRWLVVEKILAPGETLPSGWPVDGTTGYEHARALEHGLLDADGWSAIARRWASAIGDDRPFPAWELDARREVLEGALRPDRDRVAHVAAEVLRNVLGARPDVVEAVTELSAHLDRYRTYLPDDPAGRRALETAHDRALDARPDLGRTLDRLCDAILEPDGPAAIELRTRWQQLTGPVAAKGVEDRALWRYAPLASLGEVGGRPHPDVSEDVRAIEALHHEHTTTQAHHPATMLAGTTHDTARSEDVRAFGLALAVAAGPWVRVVDEWIATSPFADVDVPMQWLALQTAATTPELSADRFGAFLVKAAREADRRTSWTDPDESYEDRLTALAGDVLAWPPIVELAASLERSGRAMALAMLAVRTTAPGVPDVYQGTEAARFVLVDPDNRTAPDHDALDMLVRSAEDVDGRAAWAEPGAPLALSLGRAVLLRRVLAVRRRWPGAFGPGGGYRPLVASGPSADHVIAFERSDVDGTPSVITVVAGVEHPDAYVALPGGRWRHVLLDDEPPADGEIAVGPLLDAYPAIVLVREPVTD